MSSFERRRFGPGAVVWLAAAWLVWAPAGPARAASPFEGVPMTLTWELWSVSSPGGGGTWLANTDSEVVIASDAVSPDIADFHDSSGNDYELWDVDFEGDEIVLTYTSIYAQDHEHQYMYMYPTGFHFADLSNSLPEIVDVVVDDGIAPFGFDVARVHFGPDDIWVDLMGSMCHYGSMGSMPDCNDAQSPTGFDNQIVLQVTTVPEPGAAWLLPAGLLGLRALHRQRRRRSPEAANAIS